MGSIITKDGGTDAGTQKSILTASFRNVTQIRRMVKKKVFFLN